MVTAHLPSQGREAASLAPGGATPLGSSYRLDDAPRFEAFYFVTAGEPFALEPVLEAARRAAGTTGPLSLPAGLQQSLFLLRKDDSR